MHIRLFSTDLDGTLLGNPAAVGRFTQVWNELHPGSRPLLVYNTGRSVADTLALVAARRLPEPDYIIGSVGTELHDSLYNRAEEFRAQFRDGWDVATVDRIVATVPGIKRQPGEFVHAFKSSWFWIRARREDVEDLARRLEAAGVGATMTYSCRYFLDIVPACAGKGRALAWLCARLEIPLAGVLVAGDTSNDTSMFLLPEVRGILVENALPELRAEVLQGDVFSAPSGMADGLLEGLIYFGVIAPGPLFAAGSPLPSTFRVA